MTDRFRHLAWPAYSVGFALTIVPLADALLYVWPLQLGVERWRFGAVGMLSNALLLSNLGVLVTLGTAMLRNHRGVLKALGAASAAAAAFASVVLVLFVIDSARTSAAIGAAQHLSYAVATATAVIKQVLAVVSLTAFAIAGLRSAERQAHPREGRNMLPLVIEHV